MELNIGNSVFPGLNDKNGLMICGYEWGFSEADRKLVESGEEMFYDKDAVTTFSNKFAAHGERAFSWKYDNRIIKWFSLWGHPLSRDGLGGDFEKSIVQTNWCNSEGHKINENYFQKLTALDQIENFIFHIKQFEPHLIFFMGSEMINVLQHPLVSEGFSGVMGVPESKPSIVQKPSLHRRFKIGFQEYEKCNVVSMPHPSSSRGLSDDYISLFSDEISSLILGLKKRKGING